jgi:hypothetical protein
MGGRLIYKMRCNIAPLPSTASQLDLTFISLPLSTTPKNRQNTNATDLSKKRVFSRVDSG